MRAKSNQADVSIRKLRNRWKGQTCKLSMHGRSFEARIGSAENGQFAAILTHNPPLPSVQFSWPAVERIMLRDGVFQW
jgi:hypothetical protein